MTRSMTRSIRAQRRGFATITAIVLVGFVGVALSCVALALSAQARRSGKEANSAQLRQLVLAGSLNAKAMIDRGDATPHGIVRINLPAELQDAQLQLRFTDGKTTADISATVGNRSTTITGK